MDVKRCAVIFIVATVVAQVGCTSGPRDAATITPTSSERILELTEGAYRRTTAYADLGELMLRRPGTKGSLQHVRFFTFLRRPQFLFVFGGRYQSSLCASQGLYAEGKGPTRTWTSSGGDRLVGTLGDAVAMATGVSGGAAHMIPRLLFPDEVQGNVITQVAAPRGMVVADENCGRCVAIEGDTFLGATVLVIDTESHLIRRVEWAHGSVEFSSQFNPDVRMPSADDIDLAELASRACK